MEYPTSLHQDSDVIAPRFRGIAPRFRGIAPRFRRHCTRIVVICSADRVSRLGLLEAFPASPSSGLNCCRASAGCRGLCVRMASALQRGWALVLSGVSLRDLTTSWRRVSDEENQHENHTGIIATLSGYGAVAPRDCGVSGSEPRHGMPCAAASGSGGIERRGCTGSDGFGTAGGVACGARSHFAVFARSAGSGLGSR